MDQDNSYQYHAYQASFAQQYCVIPRVTQHYLAHTYVYIYIRESPGRCGTITYSTTYKIINELYNMSQ